jgi:hypothetical protein
VCEIGEYVHAVLAREVDQDAGLERGAEQRLAAVGRAPAEHVDQDVDAAQCTLQLVMRVSTVTCTCKVYLADLCAPDSQRLRSGGGASAGEDDDGRKEQPVMLEDGYTDGLSCTSIPSAGTQLKLRQMMYRDRRYPQQSRGCTGHGRGARKS